MMVVFVVGEAALSVVMEWWRPAWRDREFGVKLARLRAALESAPGKPLVLMLGSSRVATGIRPERWRDAERPDQPLVFNAGVRSAGPLMQRLWLQRFLDEGVKPDWVILEYWPPACLKEETLIAPSRLGWRDGLFLSRYVSDGEQFLSDWLGERVLPAWSNRYALLNDLSPHLVAEPDRWERLDQFAWRSAPTPRDARHAQELLDAARRQYRSGLAHYRLPVEEDHALRDALQTCRERGIRTAVIFMPEARAFQQSYPPRVSREVSAYLKELQRDTGAVIFDCRDWLPDSDFSDGFHLLSQAAERFSDRFAEEVLPRMLPAAARRRP
jgi:hypothetical protein